MHRHGEALSYPVRTSVSGCLTHTLPPLSCLDLDQYTEAGKLGLLGDKILV